MYTSFRISRFWEATFLTTWAKYSETLRPFDISFSTCYSCRFFELTRDTAYCYQSLHGIKLLPVTAGIELTADVFDLVIGCIEVDRVCATSYCKVSCVL